MVLDSIRDLDPRNAGPVVFVAVGLVAVLLTFVVAIVWLTVDQDNERRRCSNLVAGADLSGCSPVLGRLVGKDLSGADLTGATLVDKDLPGVDLSDANLSGADLSEANLTEANLTEANLTEANLTRTDLTDADLTGADLTGVVWDRTICPDGQPTPVGEPC